MIRAVPFGGALGAGGGGGVRSFHVFNHCVVGTERIKNLRVDYLVG